MTASCTIKFIRFLLNPFRAEGEKIKIRQFNFELNFNRLICKGNGLSQCSLLCAFGNLWVIKVSISFLQQLDLKNKIKHRYNYTDSALMG